MIARSVGSNKRHFFQLKEEILTKIIIIVSITPFKPSVLFVGHG